MSDSTSTRAVRARMAAYASWAQTDDATERTAPARAKADERFVRQVDPHGLLAPAELARRVSYARKAYFLGLALKSAEARRRKAAS